TNLQPGVLPMTHAARAAIAFIAFLLFVSLLTPLDLAAQQKANERKPQQQSGNNPPTTTGGETVNTQQDDDEVLKVETNLVSFPVVVNMRDGAYVPDVRKEEITALEDGAEQQLVFFSTITQPFHVVLMLDTSASTEEKIGLIRQAAAAFAEQLQSEDRVKVISFDDEVRDHNVFTNSQAEIKRAINMAKPGRGTKLYDAFQLALDQLRPVQSGRKAIVIFTDGVDYRSDVYRYDQNLRALQESGVIVYPIRYDTRAETEQLARRQASGAVDLGAIINGGGDTTSGGSGAPPTTGTTFPGGTIPLPGGRGGVGGLPFPAPVIISRPRTDPNDPRVPRSPDSSGRYPDGRYPDERDETLPRQPARDDSIGRMLDGLYQVADNYLEDLVLKSGGKLVRADTLARLPAAFKEIADELRTQYSIGYYPTNAITNGGYRRVKVRTTRKGALVRTRPGYIAKSARK
ncbi:MAG: VWA domain-containing protein, partial [Pyrinomonadaceae bacterium]